MNYVLYVIMCISGHIYYLFIYLYIIYDYYYNIYYMIYIYKILYILCIHICVYKLVHRPPTFKTGSTPLIGINIAIHIIVCMCI